MSNEQDIGRTGRHGIYLKLITPAASPNSSLEIGGTSGSHSWIQVTLDQSVQPVRLSLDDTCNKLEDNARRVIWKQKTIQRLVVDLYHQVPMQQAEAVLISDAVALLAAEIQQFCQLVDRSTHLPWSVVPLRYPLMVTLHNVEEQVRQLMIILGKFQSNTNRSVKQLIRDQEDVEMRIKSLVDSMTQVVELTNSLVIRARLGDQVI